jgi:hypothetical protein
MGLLLQHAFARLENTSNQASTFLLAQAMGGGKTHSMIALGLLAKNPNLREKILGKGGIGSRLGKVKVIGFNGRESDAPFGLWGELAEQLGKKELFKDNYSPLKAPGTTAWINLLKGEPTLIFLDELPPYMENARAIEIGNSDLAVITATAISNLLVAVDRPELSNVCVVISDLSATYEGGSGQLNRALHNLENETGRAAMRLEPVNSQGSELYHILRTRLFSQLPDESVIKDVASKYAAAVREAKQMDVTNASPDSYAAQLIESYPFHFSMRDLYARFKENPGFQQTRGLIRLLRAVVSNMYTEQAGKASTASSRMLIHPYDLDLNDSEILSEVKQINPSLGEAITHDIAKDGHSIAEELDQKHGGTDFQDVAKLLLVSSLASIPSATHGLRESDIVGFLCSPGRDISQLKLAVIDYLPTQAWYLHRSQDGRLFFKNVQNLAAKLHSLANSYNEETSKKELRIYLNNLFSPKQKDCYQNLAILPALDEVSIDIDKTTLVVIEPRSGFNTTTKLSDEWHKFAQDQEFKNRIIFLTGAHETMERIIEQTRQLKAIETIIAELETERISSKDPQFIEADKNLDQIQLSLRSALTETFTTLVYPSRGGFRATDCRIYFEGNNFDGEALIRNTLEKVQKFTKDVSSDSFRKKCEVRLFGGQKVSSWNEVRRRAASSPEWNFHDPRALDELRRRLLEQEVWLDEGGVINTAPPPPQTSVKIQVSSRDTDTGEATLKITPVNGDSVVYEIGDAEPSSASLSVAEAEGGYMAFKTKDLRLTFKCIDLKGLNQQGPSVSWQNELTLKYRVTSQDDGCHVEFEALPRGIIRYTTDGSDPKTYGGTYDDEFIAPSDSRYVLAYAEADGISSSVEKIDLEQYRKREVVIDASKQVTWLCRKQGLTARKAFEFIEQLKKYNGEACGVSLTLTANDDSGEISYYGSPDQTFKGDKLTEVINYLQDLFKHNQGSQVLIEVEKVLFQSGQLLKDWFAELKHQAQPGEVIQ